MHVAIPTEGKNGRKQTRLFVPELYFLMKNNHKGKINIKVDIHSGACRILYDTLFSFSSSSQITKQHCNIALISKKSVLLSSCLVGQISLGLSRNQNAKYRQNFHLSSYAILTILPNTHFIRFNPSQLNICLWYFQNAESFQS